MLTVKAQSFISGMSKATAVMRGFSKAAASVVTGPLLAIAAVLTAGVVAVAAFAKKALESAAAVTKLARSVNSSVAGLAALQYQIKSLGGNQEDAAKGLGKLNEVLGEFGPEGEQARGMINRLGLSFEQLSKLSSDKAFAAIAEKIGKIEDPAQRAAAATAIFGDQAAALLPALTQGSKGLTAAQKAAEMLGLAMSDLDASRIEDANNKLGLMGDAVKGITAQFAVQLAPWILKTAEEISKLGVTGQSVGKVMATAFRYVAKAIAFVGEYVHKQWILNVSNIQIAFTAMVQKIAEGLRELMKLAAKLPDRLGGKMFGGLAEEADRIAGAAKETVNSLTQEALAAWDNSNYTEKVDAFFDNIVSGADAAGKAMESMNTKLANGALPIAQRFKKLFGGQANAVIQEVQTPLEKYQQKLAQIKAMFAANAISADQFARATAKAVEELDKAHGLSEVKLPGGLKRESSEAMSAINQQDAFLNLKLRETPQQRIERIQQQSLEIEKQQLEYAKRIAAAVGQPLQQVGMPP